MYSHKTQSELLKVADRAIAHCYKRFPFTGRCPQAIDLDLWALELMGSSIKMLPLSKDGSALGVTAHECLPHLHGLQRQGPQGRSADEVLKHIFSARGICKCGCPLLHIKTSNYR